MVRANYLPAPHYFNLNNACAVLVQAFGPHLYLVGSSLVTREYRDVDIRCILPDEEFAHFFPALKTGGSPSRNALWSVMCSAISLQLSQQSSLPVDFQIQSQTEANAEFDGRRHAIGLFYYRGAET